MNPIPFDKLAEERNRLVETKKFQTNGLPFGTSSQLLSEDDEDTPWLIEPFITVAGLCAISGSPAAGKTWIVLLIALAVSKGELFLDTFQTKQTNVLIIDEEGGRRRLRSRLKALGHDTETPIHFLTKAGFKVTVEKQRKEVIDYCKQEGIGLVILDSLVRMHTAKENDATEMNKVYESFKEFDQNEIAVIFTHHHSKHLGSNGMANMRGSSDILAWVDTHFAVEKSEQIHTISQAKARDDEELPPFTVMRNKESDGLVTFSYQGEPEEKRDKKYQAKEHIVIFLELAGKSLKQSEIIFKFKANHIEVGEKNIVSALNEMVSVGDILTEKGLYNATLYSLPPAIIDPSLFDKEGEV